MTILEIEGLDVRYGPVHAVKSASLRLEEGELVVIVGANGAGKSSLMRATSGLVRSEGSVRFLGRELRRASADRRTRAGLVQVPEGRHIFGPMTVMENLRIATWRTGRRPDFDTVFELFPVLKERAGQVAATLSGGEQQMLALSRALLRHPRLLMLDEPSMGLAPLIVKQMFGLIARINEAGTSVLLVEQNARQALAIADRAYIMDTGHLTGGGPAAALLDDEALRAAYFGGARGRSGDTTGTDDTTSADDTTSTDSTTSTTDTTENHR